MRKALLKVGYRCNNSCIFCHSFYLRSIPSLTTAQIYQKIDACLEGGYEMVVLSGGEPMIRSDLLDIAARVQKRGLKLGLITNGRMLFYRDLLEKLVDSGLSYTYVSLQGGDKVTHNFLTGSDSFRQTVSGIINTSRVGLHPTINTVVNKRNIGELKTIVDLLAGIGHLKLKFSMIEPKGLAKENFTQVVPSLTNAARAVSEAISFGLDHYGERDIEFAFDAIPFCAIPEYLHLYDDLFTNGIYAMSEADEDGLVPVDYNNHCHPIPCKRCSLMGYCPGPFKEYVEKSGTSELQPVTESRSNQFIMTHTGFSFKPAKSKCRETAARNCDELSILVDGGQKGAKVYKTETRDFSVPQIRTILESQQVFKLKGNKNIPLKPLKPCLRCGGCNGIYAEAKPAGPNMKALTTAVGSLRGRVLDVGCGQVELWKKLGPMVTSGRVEYHALDPDPARIDLIARKSAKVIAHTTRIEDFSPLPGSFDTCMMLGSINHVFDIVGALGKVFEALKPGGTLIVADDSPTALVVDEIPEGDAGFEHFRNLDADSAADLLVAQGFIVERELPVTPATEPRWVVFAKKPA